MTKKELVAAVAEKAGVAAPVAAKVYEAAFAVIAEEMRNGAVRVDGFGTFKVAERAERMAKNPKTGEMVKVPAKKAVTFKPAQALKDSIQ
ncbi:MAG: HU family DNA-binding protein [Bacilli bacterium]|nr:HU family DNA-binding protein [Bacilli bacterium]